MDFKSRSNYPTDISRCISQLPIEFKRSAENIPTIGDSCVLHCYSSHNNALESTQTPAQIAPEKKKSCIILRLQMKFDAYANHLC